MGAVVHRGTGTEGCGHVGGASFLLVDGWIDGDEREREGDGQGVVKSGEGLWRVRTIGLM